ncbi:MAG: glutamate--tRNA ligase [Bacteroidales bacterium]|nr:glutamate--tRNA ligase [Bacteroidales bacterium]MCF8455012.1 glutamate--tRNA ligase [Bacteroidales bacterium]
MSQKVRVRFAPSPTGPLHIGGVRTALFNYLFAKKNGGDFILRIEDTDQTRFVPGAEEYIMDSLAWCGIKFDEGILEGGNYGPYRQSERKEIYLQYAEQLIQSGNAYFAFDTPEELDKMREEYEAEKLTFTYDTSTRGKLNNSLVLPEELVKQKIDAGEPFVLRFKMPENQEIVMNDIIRGEVKVNTTTLDDKVLFKSDGMPTYHLANIVDDHLMEISHVIRGEEWLPSLPLHVLLYRAFGWDSPEYAHLPLLLKPTGKGKLSKRDGDKMGFPVFPTEWTTADDEVFMGYRESGYFAEAFVNLLALLGWNPGTEQEIFNLDELVQSFSLEKVGKSGSRFDPEKAKWFNQQWLQKKDNAEIAKLFSIILKEKGIEAVLGKVERIVGFVKERVQFVHEIWDQASFFFEAPADYDNRAVKKNWKENTPALMQELANVLANTEDFSSSNTEEKVKAWITEKELGMGAVMNAFRLCIVGEPKGPHMFDIIEVIGKEETLSRLKTGVEKIGK